MKKTIFTGSGVAIVTPYCGEGINFPVLAQLIDFQIDNGTDAIIICGTTGEASTMSDEEHVEAIRFAVKHTAGRVPVVAGTGSNDTAYCLLLSQEAKAVGADALLLVTPYYNKTTQSGLIQHFFYIADRVDLPIILYNVPSRTGMSIKPSTYLELSKHKNIVATKEACGNISEIIETVALCGGELTLYSGNDDQIVPLMSLGGKGVISVLANIVPKEVHDICAMYLNGNIGESLKMQLKLLKLTNNLFTEVNPIPVKTALTLMRYDVGPLRMPLFPMEGENLLKLKDSMEELGLI